MAKYRKKPAVFEATRWWMNGDHPLDGERIYEGKVVRYFRRPDVPDSMVCQQCQSIMKHHGWIDDGLIVCPGDWVITTPKGKYLVCNNEVFMATYERID